MDLIAVQLSGKQAHWNIVGRNFRDLHLELDKIVDYAREAGDTIAERMRALSAVPDGRLDTVTATTSLAALPAGELRTREAVELITKQLHTAAGTARAVHDQVDAEDPSTADLLHEIIVALEKFAWLLGAETAAPPGGPSRSTGKARTNRSPPQTPGNSVRSASPAPRRCSAASSARNRQQPITGRPDRRC